MRTDRRKGLLEHCPTCLLHRVGVDRRNIARGQQSISKFGNERTTRTGDDSVFLVAGVVETLWTVEWLIIIKVVEPAGSFLSFCAIDRSNVAFQGDGEGLVRLDGRQFCVETAIHFAADCGLPMLVKSKVTVSEGAAQGGCGRVFGLFFLDGPQ